MTPGIHRNMSMADYLALDALSQEPIRKIVDECEKAAWYYSHLNPRRKSDDTDGSDAGTIAHAILLEGSESCLAIIDPADHPNATKAKDGDFGLPVGWTNKSIRAARDAARAAGKIPMLPDKIGAIREMVTAAREFIESCRNDEPEIWRAFQPGCGHSEVTMLWNEGAQLCRMRPDRIHDANVVIVDYKGSAMSVEPSAWGRAMLPKYSIGAAWYRRGAYALTGKTPEYVYLAQQAEEPYLCSLVGIDPATLALAREKVEAGIRRWLECVKLNRWRGYSTRVCYPEIAQWHQAEWLSKQIDNTDNIPYAEQA